MSNILEIAEALKDFCADYADEASVKLYPAERLGEQESGLVCIVKPSEMSNQMEIRNGGSLTYSFEVGFLKWVADEDESQTLLTQVETFIKEALGVELLDGQYVITAVDVSLLYSVTAYNRRKQFASILKVDVFDNQYA